MRARGPARTLWASIASVIGLAAILIGVNMIADARLASARLDLTQGHIYTLARGTRTVLRDLREPVTLRLYYSPQLGVRLPAFGSYADRVREMLRRYAAISHGMVRLQFLDPEPYSTTEDHALADGMQGVPLDQGGDQVYFGIAGSNMVDQQRTIAFLSPDRARFLEYDLTKLVWNLSQPHRAVVGVMSSLPLDGNPRLMMMAHGQGDAGQPWATMLELRSTFDIKRVPLDAQVIDPSIQVLLVAQPQHLSPLALYAIDQFVMRGGHLLAMVDPASEAEAATAGPDGQPPTDTSSDLAPLFKAWGIRYDPDRVVGDLAGDWRVRASEDESARPTNYVAWFNIRDGIDKNDPAIGDLQQVTVAAAGSLAPAPGAKIDFTPILSSSRRSEMIPAAEVRTNPEPGKILAAFKPDGKPRVIAARITGTLHSAFSGPPALPKGVKRAAHLPPYLGQTKLAANLVVVADTDILADRFWVQTQDFFGQRQATPFSDNGPFIINLVGQLAGGDALLGLRGRGPSERPFTRIDRMQAAAEAQFQHTAQALEAHLTAVQAKLRTLRTDATGKQGAMAAVITPAQHAEIEAARRDIVRTRERLRLVQLDLRRNIAGLETALKVLDIAAVPLLLAIAAVSLGLVRRQRRARARRAHA
jgi:ABC-type uncharacterized transport system involved in gliding motility auxiliary subunit